MAFATEVPGSAADSRAREDAAHPDAGTTPDPDPTHAVERTHSEHAPWSVERAARRHRSGWSASTSPRRGAGPASVARRRLRVV
nr:hypothetical protein [Pseudonocardia sp. ICBG1293]